MTDYDRLIELLNHFCVDFRVCFLGDRKCVYFFNPHSNGDVLFNFLLDGTKIND